MTNTMMVVALGIVASTLAGTVGAEALPKSGTFLLNSGWKAVGETAQVGEGRVLGWGAFYGVTFNQRGSGPLHMGTGVCNYILDLSGGIGPGRGTCAWTDADGDKIYTDYSGALAADGAFSGMNQYTSGTGKFAGITGKAPFQCKALTTQGHFGCTQQFEYRVP